MEKLNIRVKKIDPRAEIPTYGTTGAAGFDFYAIDKTVIGPGETVRVSTGLAFEIPPGFYMQIVLRSSMGARGFVSNPGIIDSDYRGPVFVSLTNTGISWKQVEFGDRIAQGIVLPRPRVAFVCVDELTATARGSGGFGSTGK